MPALDLATWDAAARALLLAAAPHRTGTRALARLASSLRRAHRRLGPDGRLGAEARRALTLSVMTTFDVAQGRGPSAAPQDVLAAKCALAAAAALTGDWHLVPRGERDRVHAALAEVPGVSDAVVPPPPTLAPPAAARPDDGAAPFGFLFPWRRTVLGLEVVIGRGLATMPSRPASDLRVACVLATPDGGLIDVLELDGTFLRPVLAPGTWSPATMAGFRDAVGHGAAWRDNPFLPATTPDRPCLSLTDYASMAPDDGHDGHGRHASAGRARAGRLLLVDGVVHRTCGEPYLEPVLVSGRGPAEVRLAWGTPDGLSSTADMDTFLPGPTVVRPLLDEPDRVLDDRGPRVLPPLRLPVSEPDAAAALAWALASAIGAPVGPCDGLVASVDQDVLPRRPAATLTVLAALAVADPSGALRRVAPGLARAADRFERDDTNLPEVDAGLVVMASRLPADATWHARLVRDALPGAFAALEEVPSPEGPAFG